MDFKSRPPRGRPAFDLWQDLWRSFSYYRDVQILSEDGAPERSPSLPVNRRKTACTYYVIAAGEDDCVMGCGSSPGIHRLHRLLGSDVAEVDLTYISHEGLGSGPLCRRGTTVYVAG